MRNDRLLLSLLARTAALESIHKMSHRLISRKLPSSWGPLIASKVESIIRKEVVSLISPDTRDRDLCRLVQAIGEMLGIAYLADYALETDVQFEIDCASEQVLLIACSVGANERYVVDQLGSLQDLYYYECEHLSQSSDVRSMGHRYLLKSSDVVFVQLLALHVSGQVVEKSTEHILRCAGAALDVYDDLIDMDEDAGKVDNPFVSIRGNGVNAGIALFQNLTKPFVEPVASFVTSGNYDVVRTYCKQVLRRLDAICEVSDATFASL